MSKRAVDELMKLKNYNLPNGDLCDKANIQVDGELSVGVSDERVSMVLTHPKFNTDLHPLVVGLQYQGKHLKSFCFQHQFVLS